MVFKNITDDEGNIIFHGLCSEVFGTSKVRIDSRVIDLISLSSFMKICTKHFGILTKILYEKVEITDRIIAIHFWETNHIIEIYVRNVNSKKVSSIGYMGNGGIPGSDISEISDYSEVTWFRIGTLAGNNLDSNHIMNHDLLKDFYNDYNEKKYIFDEDLTKTVYFILERGGHLSLDNEKLDTSSYGESIIKSNYNDSFKPACNEIVKFVKTDGSGLILLSGPPGTGKSSFIMHLISMSQELDKKIVLIPSNFGDILMSPSFMSFAIQTLKDSILVIEDSEHILKSRKQVNNTAVTNILNLTDGILSSILQVKIIATLNVDEGIDEALLRKGRLKVSYYFDKLVTDKSNKLLKKLGSNKNVSEPHTLADIYNISERVDFDGKNVRKKPIGFSS